MRRWAIITGALGMVIVVAFAAARRRPPSPASTGEIVHVVRRDVGTVVKATGMIKASVGAQVRVGSRISGVVNRLCVKVGDSVARGQLLAELDDHDLVARRDEAAANLERARAELRYAQLAVQRQRELHSANVLSSGDLDLAERAFAVARQQVAAAEATLRFASTQVAYARIVAPIAGVVASVSTQEGETVAASFAAPTFVTLIDLSRLEVWAYVDETDIGRLQPGQPAKFTVDTYPEVEFDGEVTTIYPQAEIRDNVVDYIAVIRFQPPRERVLRPDMTTTVRVALQVHEHALTLPLGAVRWDGRQPYVLAVRGGPPERRVITTGIRDERDWEVLSGINENDAVLVGDATVP